MLNAPAIATLFPDRSTTQPPISWVMAEARDPMVLIYPMRRSLAPEEVTSNVTKGLATFAANEFQKA
jgi:hypothetical protein